MPFQVLGVVSLNDYNRKVGVSKRFVDVAMRITIARCNEEFIASISYINDHTLAARRVVTDQCKPGLGGRIQELDIATRVSGDHLPQVT